MYPESIQRLIDLFSKFPTIGPRTAARFVFYLMKLSKEETEKLTNSILEMNEKIDLCKFCFNPFQPFDSAQDKPPENLCQICSNPKRDKTLLCVVEKECDLVAIEKTNKYKGLYFILGGTVSALKKKNIDKLRIKELEERIKNPERFGLKEANLQEIIIATNPTAEGEATALYLERFLKHSHGPIRIAEGQGPKAGDSHTIKITRLGRGLPVGGELEYADEETLESALDNRK